MQLMLTVQVQSKAAQASGTGVSSLALNAGPGDTIASLKQRVEAMEPLAGAFPGASVLKCRGRAFADQERLEDCGIKLGSRLTLILQITIEAFAQQLEELLQAARMDTVPLAELGLMYSYRYGLAAGCVLTALGHQEETLGEFMHGQKQFVVDNENARLLCRQPCVKPASKVEKLCQIPEDSTHKDAILTQVSVYVCPCGVTEASTEPMTVIDDVRVLPGDTGLDFKSRVCEMESVPFTDQELHCCGQVFRDDEPVYDRISKIADDGPPCLDVVVRPSEHELARQLAAILLARPNRVSSPDELSLIYCCKHGVPVHRALRLLGLKTKLRDYLQGRSEFVLADGFVTLAETRTVLSARLMDKVLEAASCLNSSRIETWEKHTDNKSACQAGATFFLAGGLPLVNTGKEKAWKTALLQFLSATLQERLCRQDVVPDGSPANSSVDVQVVEGAVRVCSVDGNVALELHVAPANSTFEC